MLQLIILVCAMELPPQECRRETALDIVSGPRVSSVLECGLGAQVLAGRMAALRPHPGEYMKIRCEPLARTADVGLPP